MKEEDKQPKKIEVTLVRDLWFGSRNSPKTLDVIIGELQLVWWDNNITHDNIHISVWVDEIDDYGHEKVAMSIVGERLENRSELLDRIEKEERKEAFRKENMRIEYENLKRIFENES